MIASFLDIPVSISSASATRRASRYLKRSRSRLFTFAPGDEAHAVDTAKLPL